MLRCLWTRRSSLTYETLLLSNISNKTAYVCIQSLGFNNLTEQHAKSYDFPFDLSCRRFSSLQLISGKHFQQYQTDFLGIEKLCITFSCNNSSEKRGEEEKEIDDLQAILKDKSLGITQKVKHVFQQYGTVFIAVYITSSIIWFLVIYIAVSRGVDIMPFLDRIGVFGVLEKWGFSNASSWKSSEASNFLVSYILYEIAKPLRYAMYLFGTMYCVRYLRKVGYLKAPPKSATVTDLMETQGKIIRQKYRTRIRKTKLKHLVPSKSNNHAAASNRGEKKDKGASGE